MEHTGFPSEETLAAFIDGRLDEETRKKVVQHLAECAECRDAWLGRREWGREASTSTSGALRSMRWRRVALPIAASIGVLMIVTPFTNTFRDWRTNRRTGFNEIVAAANAADGRRLEARLSGGFVYKPLTGVMRGEEETDWIRVAALDVQQKTSGRNSPTEIHIRGVAELMLGDVPQSIETMQQALLRETSETSVAAAIAKSTDARLLNDLSAAYYARGRRTNDAASFVDSWEAAERSWRIGKTPEAGWNRALAAEKLKVPGEAASAWRQYLEVDGDSAWSVEARERLSALTTQRSISQQLEILSKSEGDLSPNRLQLMASQLPSSAATKVVQELLPAWSAAMRSADRPTANRNLEAARCIADVLAVHDPLIADTIAGIDHISSEAENHPGPSAELLEGITALGIGVTAYGLQETARADEALSTALQHLERSDSPLQWVARSLIATNAYHAREYATADAALSQLELALGDKASRYPGVIARIYWTRGLVRITTGNAEAALAAYRRALMAAEAAGNKEDAIALHGLSCEASVYIGRPREAWSEIAAVFTETERLGETKRERNFLYEAGSASLNSGHPIVAEALFGRLIEKAQRDADRTFVLNAYLWRSAARKAFGDNEGMMSDLGAAKHELSGVRDSRVKERSAESVNVSEAAALADFMPRSSIAVANSALRTATARNNHMRLAQLHYWRGRAYQQLGDTVEAGRSFDAALAEIEQQREKFPAIDRRISYFAKAADIFNSALSLSISTGDIERGFQYTERRFARGLLDGAFFTVKSDPVSARDVMQSLPAEASLLEYASSGDHLVVFAMRRGRGVMRSLDIRGGDVQTLALDLRRTAARGDVNAFRDHAATAYDLLIRPVERELGPRLIIVAHDELAGIPFAALYERNAAHFLVERTAITMAPSAAFAISTTILEHRGTHVVVAVADEADGRSILQAGAEESRRIAALYGPRAVLLNNGSCTKHRFLSEIATADIVHFTGHGVTTASGEPALAMARGDDPAVVDAATIAAARVPARLVVIAGCATATGPDDSMEGPLSVARAFLAAGATNVIATTWPIADEQTSTFMSQLHLSYAHSGDAESALREAQIRAIRSGDLAWAAFQLISDCANCKV